MPGDLSRALKGRRLQLGLTLSQVARRVRTSPATISRYESGWHRFELYTLQKLASALGCRLRVGLEPVRPRTPAASPRSAIKRLGRLFWDTPLQQADLRRHPRWVIRRVLETGALEDVRILVQLLGKDKVLSEAASIRFKSPKTARFWKSMIELEG
jgi:transcriptional regulator with XRE-family HTH domain